MKSANIVNIIGIALEICGVFYLMYFDLKTHALEQAESSLRPTIEVDAYEAAKRGCEHEPSDQEQKVKLLQSQKPVSNAGFRVALSLMALGMACQLVAACLGD